MVCFVKKIGNNVCHALGKICSSITLSRRNSQKYNGDMDALTNFCMNSLLLSERHQKGTDGDGDAPDHGCPELQHAGNIHSQLW